MTEETRQNDPEGIDTTTATPARIYDYFLGGKDNFGVDRSAAEEIMKAVPEAPAAARANRGFLRRAVRYMADAGIRQFIDVGAGLPTQGNVHEVAQDVRPGARIVYVDNDPVVLVHGRALLEANADVAVVQGASSSQASCGFPSGGRRRGRSARSSPSGRTSWARSGGNADRTSHRRTTVVGSVWKPRTYGEAMRTAASASTS